VENFVRDFFRAWSLRGLPKFDLLGIGALEHGSEPQFVHFFFLSIEELPLLILTTTTFSVLACSFPAFTPHFASRYYPLLFLKH
jgi:hypothetical protein